VLAFFLLLHPPVGTAGRALFHTRDRHLELRGGKTLDRRLGRIDVNGDSQAGGDGREAWHSRHAGRHVTDQILAASGPSPPKIPDRLVNERYERGVQRKVVPGVVQVGGDGNHPSGPLGAIDEGGLAGREPRQHVAAPGVDAADAPERGDAEPGAAGAGERFQNRMTPIARRERPRGAARIGFRRGHR
jgi:hypothetical protein